MSHDGLTSPPATPRRRRLKPQRMMKVLPSLLTLGNLLCGFASIFYASRSPDHPHIFPMLSPLVVAAGAIFLGMVFDVLDGRVARMTRQTSELGEQLDSMADMVSFGVAPAFLIVQLIGIGTPFFAAEQADTIFDRFVLITAGLYVACTGLRLARFNVEIHQPTEADHLSFKGLPSPAAAGTVASLVILLETKLQGSALERTFTVGMVIVALLTAIAMVSTIRYTHVMNRYVRGRAPFRTIAAAVLIIVPLLIFPIQTVAAAFTLFTLSAPALHWHRRLRHRPASAPHAAPAPSRSDDDQRPPLRFHG
jgi:CDP-diacylglycerol--serine O-phosphatidyltransferase